MQHSRFAAEDRLAFAPPPQPGLMRAFALAVLAHLLLLLALMNGLKWQRETQDAAVEAELWSAVPQQAAPRQVVPPPPPPPPPQPVVRAPPPPPVVKAPPQPDPQELREAQIAVEREKHKRELEKKHQAELEREREQRKKELATKKREEELAQKKRDEELAKKKREEELAKKKELQKQQLAEAKRKEEEKKHKLQEQEARDAKKLAQLREDNMRRMQNMAGTGAPSATGTAARSTGPSASWGARVQARVRPNIVFSDDVSGNPEAVIEVRLAPDGTIVGKRVKKSSGNRGWDEAVLRALDKTETLPRDIDGRVPSGGELVFRPKG